MFHNYYHPINSNGTGGRPRPNRFENDTPPPPLPRVINTCSRSASKTLSLFLFFFFRKDFLLFAKNERFLAFFLDLSATNCPLFPSSSRAITPVPKSSSDYSRSRFNLPPPLFSSTTDLNFSPDSREFHFEDFTKNSFSYSPSSQRIFATIAVPVEDRRFVGNRDAREEKSIFALTIDCVACLFFSIPRSSNGQSGKPLKKSLL